jgi:transposase
LREVLNAIGYMARSGGGWRMLPNDFPPWQTVYWWFRRFVRRFMFQTIHDVALMLDRERVGREASPTGGVVEIQIINRSDAAVGFEVIPRRWVVERTFAWWCPLVRDSKSPSTVPKP